MNYSAQAIKDLEFMLGMMRDDYPLTSIATKIIIDLLRSSIKFSIPDGGKLFEKGYFPNMEEIGDFHLPFPIVALEYKFKTLHNSTGLGIDQDAHERIALCVDVSQVENFPLNFFNSKNGFYVFPFWKTDSKLGRLWNVCYGGGFIPASRDPDSTLTTPKELEGLITTTTDLGVRYFPVLPEMVHSLETSFGRDEFIKNMTLDANDEVGALLHFLSVVNCSNVIAETANTNKRNLKARNAKRIKKGKKELFEYKVLKIKPSLTQRAKSMNEGQKRKSPKEHLRRGHPRRIPGKSKPTWINSVTVCPESKGRVDKEYSLFDD